MQGVRLLHQRTKMGRWCNWTAQLRSKEHGKGSNPLRPTILQFLDRPSYTKQRWLLQWPVKNRGSGPLASCTKPTRSLFMSMWNYRIFKHKFPGHEECEYALHETYYNAKGEPWGWHKNADSVTAESPEGLIEVLERMLKDVKRSLNDVIDYDSQAPGIPDWEAEREGMMSYDKEIDFIENLISTADHIKHCGDYGFLYWNPKTKTVWLVLGDSHGCDSDDETPFTEIEKILKIEGVDKVEVHGEEFPHSEYANEDGEYFVEDFSESVGDWIAIGRVGTII